ncbi:MAG: tetratricopeptide repeat protein [Methylacidiphilales bacterium]|nr:tetratricopeptide repeat protein [Candidatus Methylacidiphilales bacterium]
MATLGTDDSNILEAEPINWRLVVYPLALAAIVLLGGFGYYYYAQMQRDALEAQARIVVSQAKTPEDFLKAADQFPNTNQATMALLAAASLSFDKKDYDAAIKDYQRIISNASTDTTLRDSAQLGLGSTLAATGKLDDAINVYLTVARRAEKSPYAPYAYQAAASLYEQKGDKDNQKKILTEAVGLGTDSMFVKEAQSKLKELNPTPATPTTISLSAPPPPPGPLPVPTPH